jgi:hypothetical protein
MPEPAREVMAECYSALDDTIARLYTLAEELGNQPFAPG